MRRKVKVKAEKTVYTYSHLGEVALYSLKDARDDEEGRFYNCMTSQLFSAFCLEAYLNHIGAKLLSYWSAVERKLSPREKLIILLDEINLEPDFGSRPFQTFKLVFQLRNALVHGKTELIEVLEEQMLAEGDDPSIPNAKWQDLLNLEMAEKYFIDTIKIIESIHEKSRIGEPLFSTTEVSPWRLSPPNADFTE